MKLSKDVLLALTGRDAQGDHIYADTSKGAMRPEFERITDELCDFIERHGAIEPSHMIGAATQKMLVRSNNHLFPFDEHTRTSNSYGCIFQWLVSGRSDSTFHGLGGIFDHLRKLHVGGQRMVVSQPYNSISGDKLDQIYAIKQSGFTISIEPASLWFPCWTSMIIITYDGDTTWSVIRELLRANKIL